MKIYTHDRHVPYKTTKIDPMSSKADIDGILARWGIKKVAWTWDPENNEVYVQFQIEEVVDGRKVTPVIRVEPPRIWNKATRKRREGINWNVSMRVMVWYIKTHLEQAYLTQSSKTTEFLPYIDLSTEEGGKKLLKDVLIPDLGMLKALPDRSKKEVIQ